MEADINLEEGEIVDNDDDSYTPLERPPTYSSELYKARLPVVEDVESEEEFESTSESDSDEGTKSKRPKLKLKPQAVSSKSNSRKKYDVWSTHVQEDLLLENLVNCDVSQVDRSRTVETYSINHVPFLKNNKRTREDRYNPHLRLPKKSNSDERENGGGTPRTILDAHVTINNTEDEIAKDIANKLCEEKEDLIRTIVTTAGKAKALELFKETQRIEKQGGMMIMNQSRRRTPGGVFLFLVKHDHNLTREQMMTIFNEERVKYKQEVRLKRKLKLQQMKQKISASKLHSDQTLPHLLTRAELCAEGLENQERVPKETLDVKNPPPSPVTDGHDNSTDGMENLTKDTDVTVENSLLSRSIISYADDFIDVGVDMDLL
ncbi:hypothetical protein RN001_001779 [Aquatica leii]|uniref:Phosphorylated adapter RNA export protein n=1 Tax=Aquatica leii TaxID=1421715 RepID=A0AAN7SR09_9COLE|nr:hypothetical protein RN001_001779 [Aquatica leii]